VLRSFPADLEKQRRHIEEIGASRGLDFYDTVF